MSATYRAAARGVLFRLGGGDAEAAHEWTLRRLAAVSDRPLVLRALRARYAVSAPIQVFGLRFPNRVGLAAGMDKNGVALRAWPSFGFGFVEVGTVTARAQPGNERPRMYRLRSSAAVINRMGFNNSGAHALAARLDEQGPLSIPLGISIGKSKITPIEDAVGDYLESFRALYPYGDYFAINVSSPNTPGLRSLQDRGHLGDLLGALHAARDDELRDGAPDEAVPGGPVATAKPILVKIAPDLTDAAIAELLEVCHEHGVAGVIATNTTLSRSGLAGCDTSRGSEAGGLSGRPLTRRALDVVTFVHRETGGRLPIIGVGGIMEPDDAVRLVDAGASLVQLYTGLIFDGPDLVRRTARALRR